MIKWIKLSCSSFENIYLWMQLADGPQVCIWEQLVCEIYILVSVRPPFVFALSCLSWLMLEKGLRSVIVIPGRDRRNWPEKTHFQICTCHPPAITMIVSLDFPWSFQPHGHICDHVNMFDMNSFKMFALQGVECFCFWPVGVSSALVLCNSLQYSIYLNRIFPSSFLSFQERTHTPLRMMNVLLHYTLWNSQHILCSVKYKHVTHNGFTSSS